MTTQTPISITRIIALFLLVFLLTSCVSSFETYKPQATKTAVPATQTPQAETISTPTKTAVPPTLVDALITDELAGETAVAIEVVGQVKVTAGGGAAHVRRGPSTDEEILTIVDTFTVLDVLTQTEQSDWFQVVLEDGTVGWIGSTVVHPVGEE